MKSITLLFVILITSSLGFSQTQTIFDKMEWVLTDKSINISDAKEEGFLMTFSGANHYDCPYKIVYKNLSYSWVEEGGDLGQDLLYFFDFEKKKLTIYSPYKKLYSYRIKKNSFKNGTVNIKINNNSEKILISINLNTNQFKQVAYNKESKISSIIIHGQVRLQPKN